MGAYNLRFAATEHTPHIGLIDTPNDLQLQLATKLFLRALTKKVSIKQCTEYNIPDAIVNMIFILCYLAQIHTF